MSAYTNITGQATAVLKAGRGVLRRITVNKFTANGVIAIYDSTGGTTNLIGTITAPGTLLQNHASLEYGIETQYGLTIVTSAASQDITAVWD